MREKQILPFRIDRKTAYTLFLASLALGSGIPLSYLVHKAAQNPDADRYVAGNSSVPYLGNWTLNDRTSEILEHLNQAQRQEFETGMTQKEYYG